MRTHSIAAIRTQVESRLGPRASAAFDVHARPPIATIPTGIDDIDRALGGIPVGAITDLVVPQFISAGQKSIQAQLLARATQEQVCALVDATDSFDPKSAQAIGVNLRQLLWVRCRGRGMKALEQAFQCADLLLQGSGGFGVIISAALLASPRWRHSLRERPDCHPRTPSGRGRRGR
jgi:RecA/RadA recombinase